MENGEFFGKVSELIGQNRAFVIATVIDSEGSTLAKPGFKLIIDSNDHVMAGSLGGGCPESAIIPAARDALSTGRTRKLKVHLEESEKAMEAMLKHPSDDEVYVETFCGGNLTIFIEPFLPMRRVILVGQGGSDSVEDALLEILKWSGFSSVLFTPAPGENSRADVTIDSLQTNPWDFDFTETDSVVVLTKGNKDVEVLHGLSTRKLRYVGLLASRKRSAKDREELAKKGVDEKFIKSIHTPIGIEINAITPREIALSIVSEIVLASNPGK